MDKKVLAGIGIIAVGLTAVFMMSRSDSGAMPGVGGGGGGAPAETKKEETSQGYEAPIFNINFPEPNFPSIPNIADMFGGSGPQTTKKTSTSWRKQGFIMNPPTPTGTIREPTRDPIVSNIPAFGSTKKSHYLVDKLL